MSTTSMAEALLEMGSQRQLPWLMLTDAAFRYLEACARDHALSFTAAHGADCFKTRQFLCALACALAGILVHMYLCECVLRSCSMEVADLVMTGRKQAALAFSF